METNLTANQTNLNQPGPAASVTPAAPAQTPPSTQPAAPPAAPQPTPAAPASPEGEGRKKGLVFLLAFVFVFITIVGGYFLLTRYQQFLPFKPMATVEPSAEIFPPSIGLPPSPMPEVEEISDSLEDEDIERELEQTQIGEEGEELQGIDQDVEQL